MVQAFVHADGADGKPLVADHFEFEVLPRVGEEVGVDQEGKEYHLRVTGVTHSARSKSGFVASVSNVNLACKLVK